MAARAVRGIIGSTMGTRLAHLWDTLSSSYWFIPTLMLLAATGLAGATLAIDTVVAEDNGGRWFYAGGAEGARTLLSAVGGSVITVAGVVFSITIAALTQASSQFGPRLLRNFMRDAGNQVTLGTFVATFLYCVLILRSIPGGEEAKVPHVSVTTAVVLAVASLGVLVFFIHHVSFSIQAPQVVATVWTELCDSVGHVYPATVGRDGPPAGDAYRNTARRRTLPAPRSGYVQAVAGDTLMAVAGEHNLCIQVLHRPGKFVIEGTPLGELWGADEIGDDTMKALADAFIIGRHRTPEQDVEYMLDQMVEIAVRALSPGINDPFTAISCVNWLGEALCRLGRRGLPTPARYDDRGTLRVVTDAPDFAGVVDTAIDQIRQYGRKSAPVVIRLLEVIAAVGPCLHEESHRAALREQAQMIARDIEQLPVEPDRADATRRYNDAIAALAAAPAPSPPGRGVG